MWAVVETGPGRIELVNRLHRTVARPTAVAHPREPTPDQEALRIVAFRLALEVPVEKLKKHLPRNCGWPRYQAMWRQLTGGCGVQKVNDHLLHMSYVPLRKRIPELFRMYARSRAELDLERRGAKRRKGERVAQLLPRPPRRGALPEVALKLGIDGTNMWKTSIEVVSASFAESGLHSSPQHVHLLGVAMGHESSALLQQMFGPGRLEVPETIPCQTIAREVLVRPHICADHAACCRLGQCHGPTSKLAHLRPCPFCNGTPEQVASVNPQHDPEMLEVDRRFGLPIVQSPPDLLHGCSNVTKWLLRTTFQLAISLGGLSIRWKVDKAVDHFLLANGYMSRHRKYGNDVYKLSEQSTVLGLMLDKGWRKLFAQPRFRKLNKLRNWQTLKKAWDHYGKAFDLLWRRGGCSGAAAAATVCEELRNTRKALWKITPQVKATPWVHMFLCHTGYFAIRLHLKRFATTAIEASHRRTKRWYRTSMGPTRAKGTDVDGLDHLLHKDWIRNRFRTECRLDLECVPLRKVDWAEMAVPAGCGGAATM
jgi:hypothetical protein